MLLNYKLALSPQVREIHILDLNRPLAKVEMYQ